MTDNEGHRELDIEKIAKRITKVIPLEEALKDVEPIQWSEDVLSDKKETEVKESPMTDTSEYGQVIDLEQYAKDGRLAGPREDVHYDNRALIEEVKRLGRPLTAEEAEKFIIKDGDD